MKMIKAFIYLFYLIYDLFYVDQKKIQYLIMFIQ